MLSITRLQKLGLALVLGVCAPAVSIAGNDFDPQAGCETVEKCVAFFDEVVFDEGDEFLFKQNTLIYSIWSDPEADFQILPGYAGAVAEIATITGVDIRESTDYQSEDVNLRIINIVQTEYSYLRERHSNDLRWYLGDVADEPDRLAVAATRISVGMAALREYDGLAGPPSGLLTFTDEDNRDAVIRGLGVVFAAYSESPAASREAWNSSVYLHFLVGNLGLGKSLALEARDFIDPVRDEVRLSDRLQCILSVLYDTQLSSGMTKTQAISAARGIFSKYEVCNV